MPATRCFAPHAEEPRASEGPGRRILRDTSLRDALRMRRFRRVRSRGAMNRWPSSYFTMSNSAVFFVPAARCCARVVVFPFASIPRTRGGRSADRRTISVVAFARRDGSARVRRGASHDAGRSPLGAPPWRFSAGGRASISGIASGSVQRAPRSQVVMPGGRCPGQPKQRSGTSGDNR